MAQAAGKRLAELLAPAPHGLIGDDDAPLGQQQFNISKAEARLAGLRSDSQTGYRDNAFYTYVQVTRAIIGIWDRLKGWVVSAGRVSVRQSSATSSIGRGRLNR